jgi:Na+-translocating ferredoxin:NAD+ oxidoreductase subunit C
MLKLFNNLKTFTKGGIHPPEHKLSAHVPVTDLPLPKMVSIPISQHLGAPARIVVERGDMVRTGQVIAVHEGFVSANIHASVSGRIGVIEEAIDSSGFKRTVVPIRVKGDEWLETIDRTDAIKRDFLFTSEEIINKVMEAGVVGMGGAAFPSHVKLSVPRGKTVDHLIINGVECEPYLTADHRLMIEKPHEIVVGIRLLMAALKVEKAIVGIENNKADAITLMMAACADYPGITVQPLAVQYPQGGEKQLIQALLDREVPSGKLPADAGAVVHNVGTTFAVYEAVQKNKPLIERIVTVTGKSVRTPSNIRVRIGTPVNELLAAAGGIPDDTGKILSGGPMMGKALSSVDVPVAKATSGILVIPKEESKRTEVFNCVRCGKCVEVCPMGLSPYYLMVLGQKGDTAKAAEEHILDCIECGSCSFVCPSNRPILDYVRLGKSRLRKTK